MMSRKIRTKRIHNICKSRSGSDNQDTSEYYFLVRSGVNDWSWSVSRSGSWTYWSIDWSRAGK